MPSPLSKPSGHGHADVGGLKLAIGALGVVYGDIGTSPLYALKECFHGEHAVGATQANVFGVLSLIFWALTFVVSIKYLTFILRADNHGEGGILALLALVPEAATKNAKRAPSLIVLLVIFGAALLYGDGVITPAISVLSAMEGLEVATKAFTPLIVPFTVVILLGLFLIQRRGTAGLGRVFGPITVLWFLTIASFGLAQIVRAPGVLAAIDPRHAVRFFMHNRTHGFLVLGAVVLSITGAEALYADMGHFGRKPIRQSWYAVVFPALLANYFGQGAYLLSHPENASSPFYAIVPSWALYPTVIVATAATVVASQALISGAYSLTQQAVQLGFFPASPSSTPRRRPRGRSTSPRSTTSSSCRAWAWSSPSRSSSALAAAYGIAVTGTMSITTIVYYVVATKTWGWPIWKAGPSPSRSSRSISPSSAPPP